MASTCNLSVFRTNWRAFNDRWWGWYLLQAVVAVSPGLVLLVAWTLSPNGQVPPLSANAVKVGIALIVGGVTLVQSATLFVMWGLPTVRITAAGIHRHFLFGFAWTDRWEDILGLYVVEQADRVVQIGYSLRSRWLVGPYRIRRTFWLPWFADRDSFASELLHALSTAGFAGRRFVRQPARVGIVIRLVASLLLLCALLGIGVATGIFSVQWFTVPLVIFAPFLLGVLSCWMVPPQLLPPVGLWESAGRIALCLPQGIVCGVLAISVFLIDRPSSAGLATDVTDAMLILTIPVSMLSAVVGTLLGLRAYWSRPQGIEGSNA